MPIFRKVLGKVPSSSKARVRNFIANRELGTQSDIHENVISPGVVLPWHYHETEEVIVVLEGAGECRTEQGIENYSAGDVIILPAGVKHSLRNSGSRLLRQICFFQAIPPLHFWRQSTQARRWMFSIQRNGQKHAFVQCAKIR